MELLGGLDVWVGLAYVLSIILVAGCIAYSALKWNSEV